MFSTRGWSAALGRAAIQYSIADTARAGGYRWVHSSDIANRVHPDLSGYEDHISNALASLVMTTLTQPLSAIQIRRQIQERGGDSAGNILADIGKHPFRGSAPNFFSAYLLMSLDRHVRTLHQAGKEGKLNDIEVTEGKVVSGGAAGIVNNFLKLYANGRSVGWSYQHINNHMRATAKRNPSVYLTQTTYASVVGSVTNLLWAESIEAMEMLNRWVEEGKGDRTTD